MSAGDRYGNQTQTLTSWKTEKKQHQLGKSISTKQRLSHPKKQRTGTVSRGETEQQSRETHRLKRTRQAISTGENHSN